MLIDDINFVSHVEAYGSKSMIYRLGKKWYMDSIGGIQLFSEGVPTKEEAIKIINDHKDFIVTKLNTWNII